MAWIMHSSGPWKDHKYKERSGSSGNYTYKYGDETDSSGNKVTTQNTTSGARQTVNDRTYAGDREMYKKVLGIKKNIGERNIARKNIADTYYADRTGYQRTNNARNDLVGDDNEAKKKHTSYNDRRKDFEKMTLTSMRNALNSAKENKKQKSDSDMRDAAVARGREQYMTNRAKKTVGAMTKAIEKKREEEKRKAYDHSRLNRIMGR